MDYFLIVTGIVMGYMMAYIIMYNTDENLVQYAKRKLT